MEYHIRLSFCSCRCVVATVVRYLRQCSILDLEYTFWGVSRTTILVLYWFLQPRRWTSAVGKQYTDMSASGQFDLNVFANWRWYTSAFELNIRTNSAHCIRGMSWPWMFLEAVLLYHVVARLPCWNPSWREVISSQPRANLALSVNYAVTRIPQAIIAHTLLLRICLISYLFRSFLYHRSLQGAGYLCLLFLTAFLGHFSVVSPQTLSLIRAATEVSYYLCVISSYLYLWYT